MILNPCFYRRQLQYQKSGGLNAHAVWLNCLNHLIGEQFYILHKIFLSSHVREFSQSNHLLIYTKRKIGANFTQIFIQNFNLILAISAIILVTLLLTPKIPIYFTAFLFSTSFPYICFMYLRNWWKNWFTFCSLFRDIDNQEKPFITRKTIL